jgi:endonuclease YncB( thermonuclease family)
MIIRNGMARATILLGMLALAGPSFADNTSPVNVLDGDTLEMQGQVVRLYGIESLEQDQMCLNGNNPWPCGQEAANSLAAFIGGQPVRCQTMRNMSGYILGVCDLNGDDLAAWMVSNGWAFADRSITNDYVPAEDSAEVAGLGVWSSEFIKPWDWRDGKRLKLPETPQTEEVERPIEDDDLPPFGPLNMGP